MQAAPSSGSEARPRRRWRRRLVRWLIILVVVWAVVCIGLAGFIYGYSRTDRAAPADVIVVLGAGLNRNNTPGPALIRRSQRGAELYHAGYAPYVICTGGFTDGRTVSEASVCADLVQRAGVPADRVLVEARSRSTEENALYTRDILAANAWDTVLIVSDGYHLLRATWIFTQQGYTLSTSPASDPRQRDHVTGIAREVVALHWQAFKTLFQLPVTYVPWM